MLSFQNIDKFGLWWCAASDTEPWNSLEGLEFGNVSETPFAGLWCNVNNLDSRQVIGDGAFTGAGFWQRNDYVFAEGFFAGSDSLVNKVN
jgi:hypothetical protein